jgi:hypothetical protein
LAKSIKCRLFGHSWRYKDLSNYMKANGERYSCYTVRKCKWCEKHQYKYAEWVDEEIVLKQDKEGMASQHFGNEAPG